MEWAICCILTDDGWRFSSRHEYDPAAPLSDDAEVLSDFDGVPAPKGYLFVVEQDELPDKLGHVCWIALVDLDWKNERGFTDGEVQAFRDDLRRFQNETGDPDTDDDLQVDQPGCSSVVMEGLPRLDGYICRDCRHAVGRVIGWTDAFAVWSGVHHTPQSLGLTGLDSASDLSAKVIPLVPGEELDWEVYFRPDPELDQHGFWRGSLRVRGGDWEWIDAPE